MRYVLIAFILLAVSSAACAIDTSRAASDAPAAIDRGLKFLVTDSLAWKKQYNCVSCHHASLPVWTLREAKERGYAIDGTVLAELTSWIAAGGDGSNRAQKRPPTAPQALNLYAVYMALSLGADPQPDARVRETLAGLRKTVWSDQTVDGSWQAWPE